MLHTPPYPLGVTDLTEDAAQSLAAEFAARGRRPAAVTGERTDAASFAAAWSALTGQAATEASSVRLFRLARLTPPRPAPEGSARIATMADRGLLADWLADFHAETGTIDPKGDLDDRLSFGGLTLWERHGQVVSLAGIRPPASGVARIGPVYTPPPLRGRGYGGAATAAVSQAALDQGIGQVVLFADLANRTSTALYQRLGFVPVEDRIELTFRLASPQR
jgi:predicted GNAT family acetyltransferase